MRLSALNITKTQEKHMNEKGIDSVEALISYLPRRYYDFTEETGLLPEDEISCLTVTVQDMKFYDRSTPVVIAFCTAYDGTRVNIMWFNQKWILDRLSWTIGQSVYVAGKAVFNSDYNSFTISSPMMFEPHMDKGHRVHPIYPKISGVSEEYLTRAIDKAIHMPEMRREILPEDLVFEYELLPYCTMLDYLHLPKSFDEIDAGRRRMLFNDLLYFALRQKLDARRWSTTSSFILGDLSIYDRIKENLPYNLTDDQICAIADITARINSGKRANSLVQGDVGSGKSIVAYILLLLFASNGYQAAIMAPTQILAKQHFNELIKLAEPFGIRIAFLGSGMKVSEKKKIIKGIAEGYYQIIAGTHAVISDKVEFRNLALCITDEEHKFGVEQRERLLKESPETHSISMSATPIPRSLAQVIYGDYVDIETIRQMPHGRKPVITGIASGREKIYRFIRKSVKEHHQTYVVCPMIDDNESMENVKSATQVFKEFETELAPDGIKIAVLTGRDSQVKKDAVITDFENGDIDVLISTTIVEVGVNVPSANLMVIENAERFGLAQMHQLRGRVGRSDIQSFCVLESATTDIEALHRLDALVRTNSGFEIAKMDLYLRGAGDFLGTKQSGDNKYLQLMIAFPEDYEIAKELADRIINEDRKCKMLSYALREAEEQE